MTLPRTERSPLRASAALAAILVVGLAVRLWLVLVAYPGQGYAGDMNLFVDWGVGFLVRGPGAFYGGDETANYPPVAILLIAGLTRLSAATGVPLPVLLKVPFVLADVAVAALVHRIAAPRVGRAAALVAAAVYLLLPAVWYDSALWGQFDAGVALGSIAAIALLIDRRTTAATVVAVLTWLFKPQGVLVLVVVGVVVLVEAIRRDPHGSRHPLRLLAAIAAGGAVLIGLLVPFDYEQLAGADLAGVPVIGNLAGFVVQNVDTAALFPVLSANAFNVWALVGEPSLAQALGGGTAIWWIDSIPVLGVPARTIGLVALLVLVLAVVVGLVVRRDGTGVLLGFLVLAVGFFALPTRSHERYLVPAFAVGAVLAAGFLLRMVLLVLAAVVNTANMHAILAGTPGNRVVDAAVDRVELGGSGPGGGGGGPPPGGAFGGQGPAPTPSDRAAQIVLPWGDLARQEWVVVVCSIAQTGTAIALLAVWIVAVLRRPTRPTAEQDQVSTGPSSTSLTR